MVLSGFAPTMSVEYFLRSGSPGFAEEESRGYDLIGSNTIVSHGNFECHIPILL